MNMNTNMDIKVCEIPESNGGKAYLRLPTDGSKLYARLYPFRDGNGEYTLGRPVLCHWIDKKRYECVGDACTFCADRIELTRKYELAAVDREHTPDHLQIMEVPVSLYRSIKGSLEQNGSAILGDSGTTFAIAYDAGSKRYSLTPALKDKTVLDNEKNLLPLEENAHSDDSSKATAEDIVATGDGPDGTEFDGPLFG